VASGQEDEAREWVAYSAQDWRAAKVLLDAGEFLPCILHCHQAVEKR